MPALAVKVGREEGLAGEIHAAASLMQILWKLSAVKTDT
jgi:hypothetical protein